MLHVLHANELFQIIVKKHKRFCEDENVFLVMLRTLHKLIRQVDASIIETELLSLIPSLYKSMSHPSLVIRKSGVFVTVEIYYVMGESFLSCLEQLNPAQMKLVMIYIKRNKKNREISSLLV